MTYRSLLVLLGHDAHCAPRMAFAVQLAKAMDCHLVGLAPTDLVDLPATPTAATSLVECAAIVWDALRDQAERAADRFRDLCHAAGLSSFEAVVDECDKAESVLRHAHCSDLAILSQVDPSSAARVAGQDLIEKVVLHSARPTLLLPYAGRLERVDRCAMVAWDDSREAARAVADALPLLRRAQQVRVVSWNERGAAADDEALRASLAALRQWLMWHGVAAETHLAPSGTQVADAMLAHAADIGADLIVMGAYGHTRLAERVLGGATRGLIETMTVPVLMSH